MTFQKDNGIVLVYNGSFLPLELILLSLNVVHMLIRSCTVVIYQFLFQSYTYANVGYYAIVYIQIEFSWTHVKKFPKLEYTRIR